MSLMNFRIGYGFDVHQLAEGYTLTLGGIVVPHHQGAVGHSDADVLLHAICDALLGAAALGDIGTHFPDTDPAYRGIDSKILLSRVAQLLREKGYTIGNILTSLCLEKPKIKPYIPAMRQSIAQVLNITEDQISIKATTNEKMGYVGREEGLNASAVALIVRL